MRRSLTSALLLAAGFCASLHAQTAFGNWLSAYNSTLQSYAAKPGIPNIYSFTVLAGNNLVPMYFDTDARAFSASVIPTPGLCTSSTFGTTGVRCAADASLKATYGSGEGLNQSRPGPSPAAAQPRALTGAHEQLPTVRQIPFPPAFPNQTTAPPVPRCDAAHDGPLVVVNHNKASVTILGSCSGTVLKTIPVTSNPLQVEILPDGSQALVTSFDGAITFIDLSTLTVSATMQVSSAYNPTGISISPDGTKAYLAVLTDQGALLTIDIAKKQVTRTLNFSGYPQSVLLTPDGSLAWVVFPLDDKVLVIDTLTNTLVRTLSGFNPSAVAFNSTGTQAFLAFGEPGQVLVIDTTTYQLLKTINVGQNPGEIGISPDDTFAVVTNFDGQSVTIINLATYATTNIPVPGPAYGLSMRY
ncbi:MAG TPA: hypothetical protein VGN17_12320 [Bryobacteraceae bacterium]|jgi:YVTN family beta-propeller protein